MANKLKEFENVVKYQENTITDRINKIQNDDDILKLIGNCANNIDVKTYFKQNEEEIVKAAMKNLNNQFINIINGSAQLASNQDIENTIKKIWSKANENTVIFIEELQKEFFRGRSETELFTKLRTIKGYGKKISLGDFIVKSVSGKGQEESEYIGPLSTSIPQIRATLQGSVSNVKGALGEQQALSYVTALLKKIYEKNVKSVEAVKGMITGDLHGELIDRAGTVQIKPDVLITYKSSSEKAPDQSLLAISAKQYSSTSMGIAHQTVRSLLAMFTMDGGQNFYDYYLQLYSQRDNDTVTVKIPSYTYLMITMNALIGHMNFFSQTTASALKNIDLKLQSTNTTSIPIPLVNAFFGFTSDAMYVVSTKQLLKDFYDAIYGNQKDKIERTYKRILSIKPKTEIDAALSLATKKREEKYKNLSVSVSLNAGMASQNDKLPNIIKKFALSEKS